MRLTQHSMMQELTHVEMGRLDAKAAQQSLTERYAHIIVENPVH